MVSVAAACALTVGATASQPVADVLERPALRLTYPARAALVDVGHAGPRIVAVGERGVIALSDDGGATWRQAVVPVSVTLTAIHFPTSRLGWAVGHGAVVLHSADGGETWKMQLDGIKAAALVLQAAKSAAGSSGAGDKRLKAAEQLVAEGPDKPLLGVHFLDARHGVVVGAYGIAFETLDGGASWLPLMNRIENAGALHLYAVDSQGDSLCIAGEQGVVLRSLDRGRSFGRIESPYNGTYFSVACGGDGSIFLGGLNGNAYWSSDGIHAWQKVDSGSQASIVAIRRTSEGRLLVADQAGRVMRSDDGGRSLSTDVWRTQAPLSAFVMLADHRLVGVGLRGAAQRPADVPTGAGQ
ncbi:WD40/YVTN/BNR-like repeat-containing protein [Methylibium sp.]|uniref:WD40/YVTN/BNR-like repeat-containing protein n=1 Tax=Methylibium sp. TaxID=2067992 RepID=UPI003D0FFA3F